MDLESRVRFSVEEAGFLEKQSAGDWGGGPGSAGQDSLALVLDTNALSAAGS